MLSVRTLFGPVAFAQSLGLEPGDVLARAGIDTSALMDLDSFVPRAVSRELFSILEGHSGDPLVALRCAEQVEPRAFDVFRYCGASTQSFEEALTQFTRWFPLLDTESRPRLTRARGQVRLAFPGDPERLGPHAGAYTVACTLRGFQSIAKAPAVPTRVELRQAPSGPPGAHAAAFGCPVGFELGEDAIVWPEEVLALQTHQPDPTLNALLQRHLLELERKAPKSTERFRDRVEHALVTELGRGAPTLASVARTLGVSPRSLQRRLSEEGTQFREALDAVRERLARSYLRTPGVTISEVAYLLGFADVPAFHHAFRTWTGQTPGEFATQR